MPLIPILTVVVGLIAAISVHVDGENKHYKCFFCVITESFDTSVEESVFLLYSFF